MAETEKRTFGYIRVSTQNQSLERQRLRIEREYPDAVIFDDKFTGTTSDRKAWQQLLKIVKTNDTIIFDSVSRMSRNAEEGIKQYVELFDKGIELIFLNEPYINTAVYRQSLKQHIDLSGNEVADLFIDATNKALKIIAYQQIEIAFKQAEKEVSDLRDRTKRGMLVSGAGEKISKAKKGKRYDKAVGKVTKEYIRKHSKAFGGTMTDKDIMDMVRGKVGSCSRQTYYLHKKELLAESGQLKGQMQFDFED